MQLKIKAVSRACLGLQNKSLLHWSLWMIRYLCKFRLRDYEAGLWNSAAIALR